MKIKITTLCENTAMFSLEYGFLAEWGLSMLIEADGKKVLLDTGAGLSAAHNAWLLKIDLSTLDHMVLSHGHTDHTGGLREILRQTGEINVVAHPEIWGLKYLYSAQEERYIGIPFRQYELESLGARFELTREPVRIAPSIMTTGEIPMISGYEHIEEELVIKEGNLFQPDQLNDDLAVIIDSDFGLVVCTGCAHRGIISTLKHAQKLANKEIIYAVVGGFHLFRSSEDRIEQTILDLKSMGVQKLAASHCTGLKAAWKLAQAFGDGFILNNAGSVFILP